MEEIEVKFLNINPTSLQAKLKKIGAKKVGHYFYRRQMFDYADWRLDKKSAWVRLRDEGDKITLAYKQRLGVKSHSGKHNDGGMQEIEIEVSDFDKTSAILLSTGLVKKYYQENKRIRWKKGNVEFDIDFWPRLNPYLEIEAPSWKAIDKAIVLLGLNPDDKKIFTANQVYKLNGINELDYEEITFKRFVKRKILKK
mgnify:CR=1 FL=1